MATDESIETAARIWCRPETSHVPMIPELAMAFAEVLDDAKAPLNAVDALLAKRPALDCISDRLGKIQHAINTAKRAEP